MGRWLEWQTGCCKADTWKKIKLGEALKQARMQVLCAFEQRHSAGNGHHVQGWGKQREVTPGAARLWGDIRADCHKHIPCPPESSANVGSGTRVKAPGLGSSWKPDGCEHILAVQEAGTSFQGRYCLCQSRSVCPEYVTLGSPVTRCQQPPERKFTVIFLRPLADFPLILDDEVKVGWTSTKYPPESRFENSSLSFSIFKFRWLEERIMK